MGNILLKLEGGDRRSIGRVDEVVADILDHPSLFGAVFEGMFSQDPVIRMRSADAIEKVSAQHPEYLEPFRAKLMHQVAKSQQPEVRWHVAQMLPRLDLSPEERQAAVEILLAYLEEKSKIVKTFSMQALAELGERDPDLRRQVIPLLEELTETGSPAMKSRGRELLNKLMGLEDRL